MKIRNMNRFLGKASLAVGLILSHLMISPAEAADNKSLPRLPHPEANIPENPKLLPTVVTAGGQRLLLNHVKDQVEVSYNHRSNTFSAEPKGWWIINYPLEAVKRPQGMSLDNLAKKAWGRPISEVKNWYVMTPGDSGVAEPPKPTEPAPITFSEKATLYVDANHPKADDGHRGTASAPLKTIEAALKKAEAGDVIRVHHGIYREAALSFKNEGTLQKPIIMEGVRRRDGKLPILSANLPFEKGAWAPVAQYKGVYRAHNFTKKAGVVTVDGEALWESSFPHTLKEGEVCFNRGSKEFLEDQRGKDAPTPTEGLQEKGHTWKKITADERGKLFFNPEKKKGIYYVSAWVWAGRTSWKGKEKGNVVIWEEGGAPVPVGVELKTDGWWRMFRMTGVSLKSQVNKFTLFVNGKQVPNTITEGQEGRGHRNYGHTETIRGKILQTGWNHLLFKFDAKKMSKECDYFKLLKPKSLPVWIGFAEKPENMKVDASTPHSAFLSEALVLGPFDNSTEDMGVYIRLKDGANPNEHVVDLPFNNKAIVTLDKPFTQLRGFELQGGMLYQQSAMVTISGEGSVLEGCLFKDPEVRAVTIPLSGKNQQSAPIVVRNNWVYRPGSLGFGSSGSSKKLTAENINTTAEGRGRMILEFNHVYENNTKHYKRMWESGGFKFFRLTGCVMRYNHFEGGDGPAIWLDWEHYNNRIEGNSHFDGKVFTLGVEASPGPHLVANNLSVNTKAGEAWFRWSFLAWSSNDTWVAFNTADDKNNDTYAWKGRRGAGGIYLYEGPKDRRTRFEPVEKNWDMANNICMNMSETGERQTRAQSKEKGLYTNIPKKGHGAKPQII